MFNSKVNDLNGQVASYNIKTTIKIIFVYMAVILAGVLATVAGMSLLGVAFPAVNIWHPLTSVMIAITATNVFVKTLGKKIFDKLESNQNDFLSKINLDLKKTLKVITFEITESSRVFRVQWDSQPEFQSSDGLTIDIYKMSSYETFVNFFLDDIQEEIRRQEEQNRGFSRYLPAFLRGA